jgi:hypothetical protein
MNPPITSYKVEPPICVVAEPVLNYNNCLVNEANYYREVEHELRLQFNEYLYDMYYKRGITDIDDYTKNRIWTNFKYSRSKKENKFVRFLLDKWSEFEDNYL